MTLSHAHFLKLIHAEPANMTHKLVYADWLEEQGSPLGSIVRRICDIQFTLSKEEQKLIDQLIEQNLLPLEMPEPSRLACLGASLCYILHRRAPYPLQHANTQAHRLLAEMMRDARRKPIDPQEFARLRSEVAELLEEARLERADWRRAQAERKFDFADQHLLEACLGDFEGVAWLWIGYSDDGWDSSEQRIESRYIQDWMREMVLIYWLAMWDYGEADKCGY